MLDRGAPMIARRSVLMGLGGASLSACMSAPVAPQRPLSYEERSKPFYPVNISEDRIIETVRGLRPYRSGGFRLEMQKLGDKMIVHNYGHGGDGVSLSWGCATLAAQRVLLAGEGEPDIAVIGGGVQGLTTALLLLQAGKRVTVYAEAYSPNVTSDVAGAIILTGPRYGTVPPDILQQVNALSVEGFRPFLGKAGYGVTETRYHQLDCRGRDEAEISGDSLLGCRIRTQYSTIMVDMSQYLPRLMADIRGLGGVFYTQRFESYEQVLALSQKTIVNCTGLGAGQLFADTAMQPIWGQLVRLKAQPEIDYAYTASGMDGNLYMLPRESSIVLGGTRRRDETSLDEDEDDVARLLREHGKLARAARGRIRV